MRAAVMATIRNTKQKRIKGARLGLFEMPVATAAPHPSCERSNGFQCRQRRIVIRFVFDRADQLGVAHHIAAVQHDHGACGEPGQYAASYLDAVVAHVLAMKEKAGMLPVLRSANKPLERKVPIVKKDGLDHF